MFGTVLYLYNLSFGEKSVQYKMKKRMLIYPYVTVAAISKLDIYHILDLQNSV
jgi:hypothetical protein